MPANKECHRNYVLISKEQHWKSPAKKLEEERTAEITTPAGKTQGKEKLKLFFDKPSLWLKGARKCFSF